VIGLRAGKVVLDTPVAGFDPQDAMSVYAKVGATPMLFTTAVG
jgi:phosphonate transport system ATP-binding protein